jgi:hypothetical protein
MTTRSRRTVAASSRAGGDLFAIADAQVYFNGADGLCVADVP